MLGGSIWRLSMARLIDKNKVLKALKKLETECFASENECDNVAGLGVIMAIKAIKGIPEPDAEFVKHACWEMVEREGFWIKDSEIWLETGKPTTALIPQCSICKTQFGTGVLEYKRCPICGAKMDKKSPENHKKYQE